MNERNYYTPQEVAKMIGVNYAVVRYSLLYKRTGWDLPFLMVGNRMRIPKKPFDAWAERMGYIK